MRGYGFFGVVVVFFFCFDVFFVDDFEEFDFGFFKFYGNFVVFFDNFF